MSTITGDPTTFPASFEAPDDGVTGRDAASVDVPFQALADSVAFLRGSHFLDTKSVAIDLGDPPWGSWTTSITGSTNYTLVTGTSLTWSGAKVGDILIVSGVCNAALVNNTVALCYGFTRLKGFEDFSGTPVNFDGSLGIIHPAATSAGQHMIALPINYQRTITKDGSLRVSLYGAVSDASEALLVMNVWMSATLIRRVST